jgi:hypothetical protein
MAGSRELFTKTLKAAFSLLLFTLVLPACKHEIPEPATSNVGNNGSPGNGNGGGNGGNGGNGSGNGIPCDPNIVYFDQQVLPILVSSCAKSNCHDDSDPADGIMMNSYSNVMNGGDIETDEPFDSDFWEALNETDPDKHMPPPGENQLNASQIAIIQQWLSQGAQNLACDDGIGLCDSVSVSFVNDITPVIQNKCLGCHTSGTAANKFVNLSSYSGIHTVALSGQLVSAITHAPGYTPMPFNGPMLSNCDIGKIRNWVQEGSLNN